MAGQEEGEARGAGKALPIGIESLDYEWPCNRVQARQQAGAAGQEKRHIYGYSGHTASQILVTALAGVAIGVTGVTLQTGIEYLVIGRNLVLQPLFDDSLARATAIALMLSISLVLAASGAVACWAPRAAGAGVAAVMALLNGCAIPHLLQAPVFVLKYVGTMASRAACLALGPEGPMIHLGACAASLVYTSEHRLWRLACGLLARARAAGWLGGGGSAAGGDRDSSDPRSGHTQLPNSGAADSNGTAAHGGGGGEGEGDEGGDGSSSSAAAASRWLFNAGDHREVCTAGAAAGLAAAFGAPIGGVLFSLEEASTHWSRKTGWRCFLCTIAATFTLAQLHPRSASGMLQLRGLYSLSNLQWLQQLPFIVVASAGGGLLGAAFNLARIRLKKARLGQGSAGATLAWAGAVAGATVLTVTLLPAALGQCLPVPDAWMGASVVRHNCRVGYYNDLATALLGDAVWVIKSLLGLGSDAEPINSSGNAVRGWEVPCYYSAGTLAVLAPTYLALMVAAASTNLPGGLFMPAIMTGGAWGAWFGLMLTHLPPSWDIQPGLYALVAATACLGGVFRSSISLVVVVVEGTRGIDFAFGIIVAVLVSNYVAHLLHPHGVYESELEKNGTVFYLRPEPPHALRSLNAGGLMAAPAVGFPALAPLAMVAQALRATTHNAFVMYPSGVQVDPATGSGQRLEGLVSRTQLLVLLRARAFSDEQGRYAAAPPDIAAYEAGLDADMQLAQALASSGAGRRWFEGAGGVGSGGVADAEDGLPPPHCGGGIGGSSDSGPGCTQDQPKDQDWEEALLTAAEAEAPPLAHLNLAPFANLALLTVRPETPAPRVYQLFLSMSLRHLVVADSSGCALGMITRKDLDHAAGKGWWRVNELAPAPDAAPPSSWLLSLGRRAEEVGQQALRSLAVPSSGARRLISVLSHALSVSPSTATVLRRDSASAGASASAPLLADGEEAEEVESGRAPAGSSSSSEASPQQQQQEQQREEQQRDVEHG